MGEWSRREVLGVLAGGAAATELSESKVFAYEGMPVRTMANGGQSRDVVRGLLATGEAVAVHESMQPAGMVPNVAHAIDHAEIMMVLEGSLEFQHDGKTELVGPGGVIYIARGTMHRVRNVGDGPMRYTVIAIGGDVKRVLG